MDEGGAASARIATREGLPPKAIGLTAQIVRVARKIPMPFGRLFRLLPCLIGFLVAGLAVGHAKERPESRFIRNDHSDKVIVFVHGFLGDSVSTWTNDNGSYWPAMIQNDHDFDGVDIFVYDYSTSLNADLTPDQLADQMRVVLASKGVSDRRHLVILSHSMGGIVTRAYLLKDRNIAAKTAMLQFYSTPTNGSRLASLASIIFHSNWQINKLQDNIEKNYLGELSNEWRSAGLNIPSYCAYEEQDTFGVRVVTFESATALCDDKPAVPIEANHLDIVKPADVNSLAYATFKANYKDALASRPEVHDSPALVINREGGSMGSLSVSGNVVTGGGIELFDNSGKVLGAVTVRDNYVYGTSSEPPKMVENAGQIGETVVSNNRVAMPTTKSGQPNLDRQGQIGSISNAGTWEIPFHVMNNVNAVRNTDGTFTSVLSIQPGPLAEKVRFNFITIALRGTNLIGFSIVSARRIPATNQVQVDGYLITKLVTSVVKGDDSLNLVVRQSKAICVCHGIVSWGIE